MEGTLRKWTNYWNGWQPRWFVLDKGMLSYYQTEETVLEGCKGAVSVAAAEISAHPSDPYRLDVVVPGEQHFYLKASSPHERQEWLMALGSVKTCLNSEKASQLLLEEDYKKRKLCELRLYCDLLVQQVHSIKSAVVDSPIPDIQKMDESTSLLGHTCDTLIRTLEECIQMTAQPSPLGYKCPVGGSSGSGVVSESRISALKPETVNPDFVIKSAQSDAENKENSIYEVYEKDDSNYVVKKSRHVTGKVKNRGSVSEGFQENANKESPKTFFGNMNTSFAHIRLRNDGSIPTVPFLEACSTLILIFDLMGSTAFAPVKMDVNGNIRKLTQKYESDPEKFDTLHQMVHNEIERKTTDLPNSATDALLWLKRGIDFLREFIYCFQMGETDLTECANKAYAKSLKKYHGWVIRGVFSIAANAAPSRADFLKSIHGDFQDTGSPEFNKQLHSEITSYLAGIDRCLRSLNRLYEVNGIDKESTATE